MPVNPLRMVGIGAGAVLSMGVFAGTVNAAPPPTRLESRRRRPIKIRTRPRPDRCENRNLGPGFHDLAFGRVAKHAECPSCVGRVSASRSSQPLERAMAFCFPAASFSIHHDPKRHHYPQRSGTHA